MILFDSWNTSIPKISREKSRKIVKDLLLKRDELWFIDVDQTIDIWDNSSDLFKQEFWDLDVFSKALLWVNWKLLQFEVETGNQICSMPYIDMGKRHTRYLQ